MISISELLTELVRRPSVNPMGRTDIPETLTHEHRVTDFLEAFLRMLGVEYRRENVAPGRDNLVAFHKTGSPFTVLWEAHQDTVPVDGMTIEPFAATIRNGRLYGRGSCDVKAGIACMLTAFARLVKDKPKGAGIRADFAIVAEPTLLNIVTSHKGVTRWTLETSGRACHSSRPDQGVSAVYRMAKVLNAIEEYAAILPTTRSDPKLGPPTISVGVIAGGVSPNTVPDHCAIQIDRRLLPGEDGEAARRDLAQFLDAKGFSFPTVLTMNYVCSPLSAVADENPNLKRLGDAIDSIAGKHERIGVPFGTDASTIANAGIPAVVFGPGDIAQAHTKEEWVELRQVEQAAEILFSFATR
jgi:acetylornithine deacetylase/succinyl-diaminopimelate desuccinylase-like protein